jgi:hypothetical protein
VNAIFLQTSEAENDELHHGQRRAGFGGGAAWAAARSQTKLLNTQGKNDASA